METMVVVTDPGGVKRLLLWSERLARAWGSDRLTVLCCRITPEPEPIQRLAAPSAAAPAMINDLGLTAAAGEAARSLTEVSAEVFSLGDPAPVAAIRREMRRRGVQRLIIGVDGLARADSPASQLADRLLRSAGCEAVLLDPGGREPDARGKIAVAMGHPGATASLRLAAEVAGPDGVVKPVLVKSEFSEDAREVAGSELTMLLSDAGIAPDTPGVEPAVALADTWPQGLLQGAADAELVIIPNGGGRKLRELRTAEHAFAPGAPAPPPIAVHRRVRRKPLSTRAMRDALKAWLPEQTLADRIALFERIQGGARWNADFAVMIGLSAVIATLGLKIDSIPVIIGAMLVAPLMTPLIGAGLALAQGNVSLFRRAVWATVLGVLTGLALSTAIGIITLKGDLPLQVVVRGKPHLFDLFIALVSGVAAAYAFSRAAVAEAVAGVAIAAALVPPLAAVGLALAYGRFVIAEGAAVLLTTNLAAIILGAAMTFNTLGARGARIRVKPAVWARRTVLALCVLVALLLLPLGKQVAKEMAAGQMRPMTFPLSKRVRTAIAARVADAEGVELLMAGRSGVEGDVYVAVILAADGAVDPELIEDIRAIAYTLPGHERGVAVWVLQKAPILEAAAATDAPYPKPASAATMRR